MNVHRSAPTLLALSLLAACAGVPDAKQRKAAEIHHDIGLEALRAGRAPEALKEFDAALEVDPRFAEAWLGKGLVLEFAFDKTAEAEQAYRKAIALKPSLPEAENNLGQLLARTGRTEEAIRSFDAALSEMSYREPWVARMNKGLTLYRANRRDEGIAEMRACLRVSPAYCAGHRQLGQVYFSEGRVADAIDEFRASARYCEKSPDAHRQLGDAYKRAADLESARGAYQRCADLGMGTVDGEECRRALELLQ
jgi:type IV pilus assembly protein PilF